MLYAPIELEVSAKYLEKVFKEIKGDVDVRGWVDEPTEEKEDEWTNLYSDHALLYFELQKV